MCFINTTGRIHIATKDIVCYKRLSYDLRSILTRYEYILNRRTPPVKLSPERFSKGYAVDEGYHSYMNLNEAKKHCLFFRNVPIHKAIIPKGSQYMKSTKSNEYVSSSIIIKERV